MSFLLGVSVTEVVVMGASCGWFWTSCGGEEVVVMVVGGGCNSTGDFFYSFNVFPHKDYEKITLKE